MLLLISSLKLIVEIALLSLFGQWVLGLLAGQKKDSNVFYKLLEVLSKPFVQIARLITPKVVIDRHVPLVAFLLLVFAWLIVTWSKVNHCIRIGVEMCQ
ncbi:hypothetical protein [uncultured Hydrogenophaga sp.]|uniref:hypothetical protein n=1 Tax=uncultured Hydrogenophaga sp. TaxID=199683 RepID=UPI00265E9C6B|nr:hypothetical protein [uncultured Hydrogenophaga sp.]